MGRRKGCTKGVFKGRARRNRFRLRMIFVCNNLEEFEKHKLIRDENKKSVVYNYHLHDNFCVDVGNRVRKLVGYSPSTGSYDIGWSMFCSYNQGKHKPYLKYIK